jgi:hypothetical protein
VDGQVYFHRFFCALKPCIDGFLEGCRPHLSIDATTLNGKWNGQLAAAVAVDGHNWMYPVNNASGSGIRNLHDMSGAMVSFVP